MILGTKRTEWNDDWHGYVVRLCENETLNFYTDTTEERVGDFGHIITRSIDKYIGGDIIELLAEYENTGLTPEEIRKLKYIDIKNLQASNEMLRKNNDEYYVAYQKLLDENRLLKKLLKNTLEKEIG